MTGDNEDVDDDDCCFHLLLIRGGYLVLMVIVFVSSVKMRKMTVSHFKNDD